jgi:hypothetical protein
VPLPMKLQTVTCVLVETINSLQVVHNVYQT